MFKKRDSYLCEEGDLPDEAVSALWRGLLRFARNDTRFFKR